MKKVKLCLGLLWLAACQRDATPPAPAADCLVKSSALSGQVIEGEYIVTFNDTFMTPAVTSSNARMGARTERLLEEYDIAPDALENTFVGMATQGFVAHLTPADAEALASDPAIATVEPDRIVSVCACIDLVTSTSLTWSVRKTGFGNGLNFRAKTAWIIDTGIDLDHPDLSVDTQRSRTFISGQTSADDNNGHGTHVAGIIGALNNQIGLVGIASGTKLVALKVLNQLGEGRLSSVISAVAYVSQNGSAGDVVNMSLGMEGASATLDREVQAAATKGILFAIAAGNDSQAARDFSPARVNHPNVVTVSAVDSTGTFARFSNYGNDVVDVAAYGVRISSTYANGRYAVLSGTSMATPHVAGLMLIRGRNIPTRGVARNDPDGTPDPIARE